MFHSVENVSSVKGETAENISRIGTKTGVFSCAGHVFNFLSENRLLVYPYASDMSSILGRIHMMRGCTYTQSVRAPLT